MSNDAETWFELVGHEECEKQPIHKPDAIQAQGWLMAFDLANGRLTHISANLVEPINERQARFAETPSWLLRGPSALGSTVDEIVSMLELPRSITRLEAIDGWKTEMPWLSPDTVILTAHSSSDHYILEIESDVPSVASDPTAMIATLLAATSWQAFAEAAVVMLGQAFGYSRIMAYKIHADGHGEVIAEHLNGAGLQPFLGLHYPAADIPAQARRLYVLQLVRVIADIDTPAVPLLAADATDDGPAEPKLDLTFARNRAVAPVHLQYMRNMGSFASVGVSVVHSGRLTAMFVMHHSEPRRLSQGDRSALSTLSRIASFVASTMDEKESAARRSDVTALAEELRRNLTAGDDPISCIEAIGDSALNLVGADGLVARVGRDVVRRGAVPDQRAIDRCVRDLSSAGTSLVRTSNCLAADMPDLASDACAGAIIARLPGNQETYLAWFRPPFLATVRWGGQPSAGVRRDESGRLYPRASFDEFVQNVTDSCVPWTAHDLSASDALYHAVQSGLLEHSYRQLAFEATVDSLTRLGNRRALSIALDEGRVEQAKRPGNSLSLLFLDLDRFKQINDAYGHDKGDLVLRATASRIELAMSDLVGKAGTLFRLGGDEFVVLLSNVETDVVAQVADRIVQALADPMLFGDARHVVTASLGAVVDVDFSLDTVELLRRGDLAMYSAKRSGGSRVSVYDDNFSKQAVHRLKVEQDLYRALEGDELVPAFQPIVSLRTRRIVGAEALARWREPSGAVSGPAEFIQLAEETGQIRQIDQCIVRKAVGRCVDLWSDSSREFHLSVNASAKTLEAQYVDYLVELIDQFAIPPGGLTVELTESAMVQESARLKRLLAEIRSVGVKVAIDDFGTGYSSLAYLETLPADFVKLDRAFVERLHGNAGEEVFARWAIQLVSELGMEMIAEGVETREQEEILLSLGYDWVQGYRYGQAVLDPPEISELGDLGEVK